MVRGNLYLDDFRVILSGIDKTVFASIENLECDCLSGTDFLTYHLNYTWIGNSDLQGSLSFEQHLKTSL
jgi:hypothetical protein